MSRRGDRILREHRFVLESASAARRRVHPQVFIDELVDVTGHMRQNVVRVAAVASETAYIPCSGRSAFTRSWIINPFFVFDIDAVRAFTHTDVDVEPLSPAPVHVETCGAQPASHRDLDVLPAQSDCFRVFVQLFNRQRHRPAFVPQLEPVPIGHLLRRNWRRRQHGRRGQHHSSHDQPLPRAQPTQAQRTIPARSGGKRQAFGGGVTTQPWRRTNPPAGTIR